MIVLLGRRNPKMTLGNGFVNSKREVRGRGGEADRRLEA
jgi:hypothetical protein